MLKKFKNLIIIILSIEFLWGYNIKSIIRIINYFSREDNKYYEKTFEKLDLPVSFSELISPKLGLFQIRVLNFEKRNFTNFQQNRCGVRFQ